MTPACKSTSSPSDAPAPIAHSAPIDARSPIVTAAPTTAPAPIEALAAMRAVDATVADGCTPGDGRIGRMQRRRSLRVHRVRIGVPRAGQRRRAGVLRPDDHGRRARRRELAAIARIGEKGDRAGLGAFERRDAGDDDVAVAVEPWRR